MWKPVVSLIICASLLPAQQAPLPQAPQAPLTVNWLMRGPALYGYAPRSVRWSGDGQRVYFQWKLASEPVEKEFSTWVVGRDGTGLKRLSEEDGRLAPPAAGHESRDQRIVVYAERGDIYLYDRASDRRRQLTRTVEPESNPRVSPDGKRVSFTRGGNLYALALADGLLEQLTDIRPAGSPPPPDPPRKGTESQETAKKEERGLLDVIERRAKKREDDAARRKRDQPRQPWILAGRQAVVSLTLAPDGSYVLAAINEPAAEAKVTAVPNFVTESAYTENLPSRTKVGDTQSRPRLALVQTESGEHRWLEHGQIEKQGEKEVERQIALFNPQWSGDGTKLALLGRSADNKDRWVFAAGADTGKLRVLFHLHDDAWADGPGSRALGWLSDNRTVWFQAEPGGWSHVFSVDWEGGQARQLTSGAWEVESAELSRDKRVFWLNTGETSAHERHLYSMPVTGGPRSQITRTPGNFEATPSPDEKSLAVIYSYTNRPPELFLMDNRPGAEMKRVTTSPSAEFSARTWLDAPIVQIPARDGAKVPGRLFLPRNWKAGGPAVVFVHGAGYLQNVHRWWSSYAHEYLFHHLLMERGYAVIDIDYRGSAGYGRDWRTGIYRHMGGKDLDDHVDAARWLVAEHGVDARRIGIYGGSYGGFITLMAMFTQPGVFAAGAALRPVTDWAHYNHGYTASILNLPQKDQEAYRRSSPIYHAAGLQGALLICHGMVDVNVHFQDSVRLAQKLIELGKENWELAAYPVEDHAFVEASSWADEYRRILKLFETNLRPQQREAAAGN